MKQHRPLLLSSIILLGLFAGGAQGATPMDNAVLAAMKVADQANYSWTAITSNDNSRTSTVLVGRVEKGGFALVSDKTPSTYLRQRFGNLVGPTLELAVRAGRTLIQTPEGWVFPDELNERIPGDPSGRGGRRSGRGGALPGATVPLNYAVRLPSDDLDIIIGSATDIRAERDGFVGELSTLGAAQFLSSFGQPQPEVKRASANFQCWVEKGIVIKYEVRINARVLFADSRAELPVRWTITAEIQNIGTTRFEVPREVRTRFGR